jgi:aspartyl-tRNA(Asn)/glutamyl-tRNA(Gln) amidotransferase subunit A
MARTVRDCAIMLEAMAGFDRQGRDLAQPAGAAVGGGLSADLRGKKVGIPKEYRIDGVPAEINAIWDQGIEWLKDAGAEWSDQPAAHQICAADLLHHRPGRGLVQPRPL